MRIDPRLLYFGGSSSNAGVGFFPEVDLYNDSTGAELVVVLALSLLSAQSTTLIATTRQGNVNNPIGGEGPVYTGQALRSGRIHANQVAAAPSGTMPAVANVITQLGEPPKLPLAILQPGWSFTITNIQANSGVNAGFWWASVPLEDIYRIFDYAG